MSKSLGNDLEIALTTEETTRKIMTAVTDPARRFRNDPGHPEVCNVYRLKQYFDAFKLDELLAEKCRTAKIGCVECKKGLAEGINSALKPLRERRAALAAEPRHVTDILADGAKRAQAIAHETLREVKQRMGLI
jgi:tryptophanyl-tRNA synthetase